MYSLTHVDSLPFFLKYARPPETCSLPLHAALPISQGRRFYPPAAPPGRGSPSEHTPAAGGHRRRRATRPPPPDRPHQVRRPRSEEHTSELQSRQYLVCRLLLEKKNTVSDFEHSQYL